MGTHGTFIAEVPATAQGRSSAVAAARRGQRYFLRALHWSAVESNAQRVRLRQRHPRLLSGMGAARGVRAVVETGAERIRHATGDRLAVAKFGRGDDQGATGWGKKPGKTRRIEANWASSGRCLPMARACPSPWQS